MADKMTIEKSTDSVKVKESRLKAVRKRFTQICSFMFATGITGYTLFLSSKFHKETEKLEKLNKVYRNEKARVAVGSTQGSKIMKNIAAYKNSKVLSKAVSQKSECDSNESDSSSNSSSSSDEEEKHYQAPPLKDIEDKC